VYAFDNQEWELLFPPFIETIMFDELIDGSKEQKWLWEHGDPRAYIWGERDVY